MNSNERKNVLITIFLTVVISFGADKMVFLIMNEISDSVYSGQSIGKINQFLKTKDTIDFVVLGSSRANHNINPSRINQNSFNMGVDGTMIAFSSTLIKLLPKNKKQIVLLHIDPGYAFDHTYTGNDISTLSTKYNRNGIVKSEIDRINKNNILQKFYWSLSYNGRVLGILKNYFKPKYDYKVYNGYDPIKVTDEQKNIFLKSLKTDSGTVCNENYSLNPLYEDYLGDIKEFCDKNRKQLILFTSPDYEDICKLDNTILAQILRNKNIKYYDLTSFFEKNNNIDYWKDKTHLSDKGSEIFSSEINRIVNGI